MKKTLSPMFGYEDYAIALMSDLGFKETERRATGGYMSEQRLQITFEGRESDYHENGYIEIPSEDSTIGAYYYFYSLRFIDGYFTDNILKFKEQHNKRRKTITVNSLTNL